MREELDTPYVHLLLDAGLLIGTYKKGLRINEPIAKEIVDIRKKFTEGQNFPALILNSGVISIDKPARDYFSSPEGIAGLKAAAIVLNSIFATSLGNFFLSVTRPKFPAKIFASETKARKWLKQYL